MGRKKFGWKDALSIGIQAAGVVGNVASAQAGVNKAAAEAGKTGADAAGKAGKAGADAAGKAGNATAGELTKANAKSFKDVESNFFKGNATNLKGAQGGVSNPALRNAQQNTGQSALVKARKDIT